MERELQEYYEHLFDLFSTPGWNILMEEYQETRDSMKIENCITAEDFWQAKGKVDMLNRFLGYEEIIKRTYDEYQNAQDI